MSEWIETTVGEIAASSRNALVGGPFGSNLVSKDYVDDGVPVIRGQNMGGRWVAGDFAYVSKEKAAALSANMARPGDIVFTQRGTLGQVALVPDSPYEKYVVSQSQMKLTVDPEKADSLFLYYLFSSPTQQEYIRQNSIQVGVPHTNLGILRDTPLCIPKEVDEQKAIARYLGTLDDKIELNRSMNETLEAMARAIFQSWFVDFDPVRAKASGESAESICQRLGLTPELLALFPDSFEDSELGEIPTGWTVGTLGDLASNPKRGIQPDKISPTTPYIALEHMPRRSIALSDWGYGNGLESNKFEFQKGEILFGKLRPYFHKVGVAPLAGVCSTDILVVAPKSEAWFGVVLGHISSVAFVEHTNAGSTGTKMPRTSWKEMSAYRIPLPTSAITEQYSAQILTILGLMNSAIFESKSLGEMRDTLLPKLLSGDLPVHSTQA